MTDEMFDRATIEAFVTEREAMLTDNRRREALAQAPAFSGDDLFDLAARIMKFRDSR